MEAFSENAASVPFDGFDLCGDFSGFVVLHEGCAVARARTFAAASIELRRLRALWRHAPDMLADLLARKEG